LIAGLGLASCVAAAAAGAVAVPAAVRASARDARIQGVFVMRGRVTAASGVLGEHVGQRFTTRWTISPACLQPVCAQLRLQRRRASGGVDTLVLHRRSAGVYTGRGRYFVPLLCKGRLYRAGGEVRFAITVDVTATGEASGVAFATGIGGGYRSLRRINHTPCRGNLGHDAAVYRGRRAASLPTPPVAAFTTQPGASPLELAFTDASRATSPGARIAAWAWTFGDPPTGSTNSATIADPHHVFSASGSFTVTLSVIDTDGLAAQTTAMVMVH
jgi:PKD domain